MFKSNVVVVQTSSDSNEVLGISKCTVASKLHQKEHELTESYYSY